MKKDMLKNKLLRRKKRLLNKLNNYDANSDESKYNYFGGWSRGYIQGQISLLENLIDELDENLEDVIDVCFLTQDELEKSVTSVVLEVFKKIKAK